MFPKRLKRFEGDIGLKVLFNNVAKTRQLSLIPGHIVIMVG